MNHDSLSFDSFDQENIISRASPKSYEQPNPPTRSRFSILTDMNEANINKKTEEQSLLSKYMKDLHDEQAENQPFSKDQRGGEQNARENRKAQENKNREANEYDWKRKNGMHCTVENVDNSNKLSENSRCSKQEPEPYGIFLYKMKIDLNKPIDFLLEDQENHHKNYAESRNSSKFLQKEKSEEDMLFGKALRQQHHRPKNSRF